MSDSQDNTDIRDATPEEETMINTILEQRKQIEELKAKLAKAMQVVEMIASADVDAVLGQAVDLSCEIIGELMEDE